LDTDKAARLEAVLTTIQQRWGMDAVRPLSATATDTGLPGVLTGLTALDEALKNGIPRGQTTELLGRPTSGMTTLGWKIIASAQGTDAYAIYVDLEGTFDPDYAAHCGIQLDRLFLVRPDTALEALDVARDLLQSSSAGVITLDLGITLPDVRRLWRLTSVLSRSGWVILLLVTLDDRMNPQAILSGSPSGLRLLVERQGWLERQSDIRGYRVRVTFLKHRTAAGKIVELNIDFDQTIAGDTT
jgi:RecA DNA recombination protein